ncbi:MAG: hypothetical protein IT216_13305 [Saprospiraceae bacterium]|nr:hypothetical protein [Saprospiraceae bacterium]
MKKLKILIISRSFHPMISPRSFRTTELVKQFCKLGHDVTLATHYVPDVHDPIIREWGFTMLNLGPQQRRTIQGKYAIINKIRFLWLRVMGILFDYPNVVIAYQVKKLFSKTKKYDLLISIAAPHPIHWGVAWVKTPNNPMADVWIADCGDPFMGNHLDRFDKPFYFKYIEKRWCTMADFITVPTISFSAGYYPEFRTKIHAIGQGFDFSAAESLLEPYTPRPVLTLGYAGSFFGGRASRDPRPFIDYILQKDIPFEFHIFTSTLDILRDYLGDNRIIVHQQIPRPELLKELSTYDFLVNIAYDPVTQSPSKLIDYTLTKRPVLNVYSDQLNDEIRIHTDQFFDRVYDNQFHFEHFQKFNIEYVVQQFIDLYYSRLEG